MATYVLVYHGGGMAQTEEEQRQEMQVWTDWFGGLGSAVKDPGNPTSQTRTISADGSVRETSDGPSGYSIIEADSIDAAVGIARGCPHLRSGGTIQVVETIDVMSAVA